MDKLKGNKNGKSSIEYCGYKTTSMTGITNNWCSHHPDGTGKGKHKLYDALKNLNIFASIVDINLQAFLT